MLHQKQHPKQNQLAAKPQAISASRMEEKGVRSEQPFRCKSGPAAPSPQPIGAKSKTCCHINLISLVIDLLMAVSFAASLKVSVSIPELVKLNDAFWLNCSHNQASRFHARPGLQGPASERIYSIKWYKDEEEFYRYLPSAEPKVSIYETNGISLDQSKSHEGNVYLTKADVNSEGNYRCEVLSEAPLFETVRKSKHLRVYALPVKGPRIEILDSNGRVKNPKAQEISYEVGDKIELRCNSAPSKPAAKLRWYLNERELITPSGSQQFVNTTADRPRPSGSLNGANYLQASLLNGPRQSASYNVRVTPVEYRQHYKGIYSSHSSLSLVLQQDDLVNSRISFKCLATMRQEVPIVSKQLIVLPPQQQQQQQPQLAEQPAELVRLAAQQRRAQYNTRAPPPMRPDVELLGAGLADELRDQQTLMYIYEDSDTTLGPSIIDSQETLERHLTAGQLGAMNDLPETSSSALTDGQQPLEFNRADNLEYVQMARERQSRQRSGSSGPGVTSAAAAANQYKRLHGLVKSPLYLDEFDSLRPVINWPPIDSGKLMLLSPSGSIVALPTPNGRQHASEAKFFMPPTAPRFDLLDESSDYSRNQRPARKSLPEEGGASMGQLILERLFESLNCTTTEASIDTKLSWLLNELPLNGRDTRHFPTRISPDHKQTWLTIGLQQAAPASQASSQLSTLASVLAQYRRAQDSARLFDASRPQASALRSALTMAASQQQQQQPKLPANEQVKLACQAAHSMLLYSSSEMITFDFNPPPMNQIEPNSAERFASLPSNVITAATASPTKSGSPPGWNSLISQGSHFHLMAPLVLAGALLSALTTRVQVVFR